VEKADGFRALAVKVHLRDARIISSAMWTGGKSGWSTAGRGFGAASPPCMEVKWRHFGRGAGKRRASDVDPLEIFRHNLYILGTAV